MKIFNIYSIGLVLCTLVFTGNAQTEEGKILIGGATNMNFSSVNSKWVTDNDNGDLGKSFNLELSPQVGYFLYDGFAIGLELPVMYSSEIDEIDDQYTSVSLAVVPFLRYYIGSEYLRPYLNVGVGVGSTEMSFNPDSGSSDEFSAGMVLYALGGGLGISLNESVLLDIGVGYSSVSIEPNENNNVNFRNITSGVGGYIGIVVGL